MDMAYLKKLVRIVENSKVDEIEVEEEGLGIRVAKNSHKHSGGVHVPATHATSVPPAPVAAGGSADQAQPSPAAGAPAIPEIKYHEVKSPIVGTFYRAPAPDAEPYVE